MLLANGPWACERGCYAVRAGSRWPHITGGSVSQGGFIEYPFYLGYATSILLRDGHDVRVIDALAEELSADVFQQRIVDFNPELVMLEVSTPSLLHDLNTAIRIKQALPHVRIAFAGLHGALRSAEFLKENAMVDYTLYGEYEYTLREVAACLRQGTDLAGVLGLVYRTGSGELRVNEARPLIKDLDELPWPERRQLPAMVYNDAPCLPKPVLMMWASRGCPFGCTFCCWPQIIYNSRKYRTRDPVKVVDEMVSVTRDFPFRSVYFDDDTFNIGDARMNAFSDELLRRHWTLPWGIMARTDTIKPGTLQRMRDAGLAMVKYGVESSSQALVNAANKNLDIRQAEKMIAFTKSLGIFVHLTFTFGLPGETWETIRDTIRFARDSGADSVQFSINTPYPGTAYFAAAQEKGLISFSS